MLWNLQSDSAASYFKSWNTSVKLVYGVRRNTFRYLMEYFLAKDQLSLRNQILRRYPGFYRKIQMSPRKEVRMMVSLIYKDPRSTTFQNFRYLREVTKLEHPDQYSSFRITEELPIMSVRQKN